MKALILLCVALTGCATMHQTPRESTDQHAKDHYECEQETYAAAQGHIGMLSNGLYRDCMRARGYK